jgi:hypothetical protein
MLTDSILYRMLRMIRKDSAWHKRDCCIIICQGQSFMTLHSHSYFLEILIDSFCSALYSIISYFPTVSLPATTLLSSTDFPISCLGRPFGDNFVSTVNRYLMPDDLFRASGYTSLEFLLRPNFINSQKIMFGQFIAFEMPNFSSISPSD